MLLFLRDCPTRLELLKAGIAGYDLGRMVCVLISYLLHNLLYFIELEFYSAYANFCPPWYPKIRFRINIKSQGKIL